MPIDPILAGISARCPGLRTGLDIGFADVAVSERLRTHFHALWMTVAKDAETAIAAETRLGAGTVHRLCGEGELPFDGNQFDVAVLDGSLIAPKLVREAHRVLKPAGLLFFSVEERVRHGPGNTLSVLYNTFLRCGFDVVSVVRPPWWRFGRDGKTLTVCARKKNWREQKSTLKVIG